MGIAILGVVSYYGGLLLGGVIIGILLGLFDPEMLDNANDLLIGILAIPFGVGLAIYFINT